MKFLLITKNKSTLQKIVGSLEPEIELHTTNSFRHALDKASYANYSVILCDPIGRNNGDLLRAIAKMRDLKPHIPIFLTGEHAHMEWEDFQTMRVKRLDQPLKRQNLYHSILSLYVEEAS